MSRTLISAIVEPATTGEVITAANRLIQRFMDCRIDFTDIHQAALEFAMNRLPPAYRQLVNNDAEEFRETTKMLLETLFKLPESLGKGA